ncbi:plastocyanin/azurin family copper-binding protein [Modestobacter sp. VKM Ac-2984]|uniref:plastocyanin/azurin family copper-binding protein n=1 Tax=Modestobacter sp. VKM Ac-2984 TaxID=3004138 RepID=UPI0022AB433A|nr:plastocyanin/azurin family copper-binding protein [Modestobacter sp. VKM Ac-2984]MCZ2817483.1 plastocyanin/azurin family copper-binding protein [Modestobacter sp. VKM Ac-2984]
MTTRSSAMSTALSGAGGGRRRLPARTLPGPLLALAVATALLAGCSSEPALPEVERTAAAEAGTVRTASDGVQEITLETGDDYVFTPDTFTVAPGEVRLTLLNSGEQMTHNFLFTAGAGPAEIAEQIPVLGPGQSDTIEFTVTEPGEYPFECSFHVALGQVGTMTVSSPG